MWASQLPTSAKVASAWTNDLPSCCTSASQTMMLSPRLRTLAVTSNFDFEMCLPVSHARTVPMNESPKPWGAQSRHR